MARTIVITGASGRLGQACTQAFNQAGWRVVSHSVTPNAPHKAARNTPRCAPGLPERADVLLHAANPPYTRWQRDAMPALQTAIDLGRQLDATLMLPGNIYNYQPLPALLLEDCPQTSNTRKGQLRIAMEARLAAAAQQGLRSVVLRAGDFFGGGTGSWFDLALASRLRKGQLVYPGPWETEHTWAYLPDLAQTFVRVAEQRTQLAAFDTLHFPGNCLTARDWLQHLNPIAQSQGWLRAGDALACKSMPWPLMRALSPLVPMWREVLEMRYLWQQPHALSGDKLQQLIGPCPHTPLAHAVPAALQALGLLAVPVPALSLHTPSHTPSPARSLQ
jgi:nucleoside-diphosphate-sugar epimerase